MLDDGIQTGDLLIVDRSLAPRAGDVVITVRAGDFTVKNYAGGKVLGSRDDDHSETETLRIR
jgi:SOS-response transcriptional repressor LexA